jgi:serine/threonine-protein kinase
MAIGKIIIEEGEKMWFLGNSQSDKGRVTDIADSFHREKTQKINTKPSVEDLEQGFIQFYHCSEVIMLEDFKGLSIGRCPHCRTSMFFPMLIKDYWLFEPLGGGGMGSVYHSFHRTNPDVEYAVKVLPRRKKNNKGLIESLMREAQIAWNLGEHQHITKVIDYGFENNEYFAVFEYIDGVRLDILIDSPIRKTEKKVLLWALQILSAEQHIYDKGYLFRDLKPQNIMIDRRGNVKLVDFGLAMAIEDAIKGGRSQIQGSPYYIPPERIVGTGESQCSEIYSLGMVMFHILAQKPYYSAEDIKSLVCKHVTSLRVESVKRKLPDNVDSAIIDALSKMIARKPSSRYSTFKDAAKHLFKIYKESA